jgi:hypothetical protein
MRRCQPLCGRCVHDGGSPRLRPRRAMVFRLRSPPAWRVDLITIIAARRRQEPSMSVTVRHPSAPMRQPDAVGRVVYFLARALRLHHRPGLGHQRGLGDFVKERVAACKHPRRVGLLETSPRARPARFSSARSERPTSRRRLGHDDHRGSCHPLMRAFRRVSSCSRSSNFGTLPVDVLGNASRNSTALGALKWARLDRT